MIDLDAKVHLLLGAVALVIIRFEKILINEGARGVKAAGPGVIGDRDGPIVRRAYRTLAGGTTMYGS